MQAPRAVGDRPAANPVEAEHVEVRVPGRRVEAAAAEWNVPDVHRNVACLRRRRNDECREGGCEEELLHRRRAGLTSTVPHPALPLKARPPLANTILTNDETPARCGLPRKRR